MRIVLLLIFSIFSCTLFAQIQFEKGYYLDNSGQHHQGYIENEGWLYNPDKISFRTTPESETTELNMEDVREFGLDDGSRYIRAKVQVDQSSDNSKQLSRDRRPEFKEEAVFLNILSEGQATLYLYLKRDLKRFFYSKKDQPITPLIYKRYHFDGNSIKNNKNLNVNSVGQNNRYQQQLWNNLKTPGYDLKDIQKLQYHEEDLVQYFNRYNGITNASKRTGDKVSYKQRAFHIRLRPGIQVSSLKVNYQDTPETDQLQFDQRTSFTIGLELEYLMPFNRNKWAVIMEPTLRTYEATGQFPIYQDGSFQITREATASYHSLELPLGVRYYMFLSEHQQLFVNGALIVDFPSQSEIVSESGGGLAFDSNVNAGFGIGYKFRNTLSLEFRYQTPQTMRSATTVAYNSFGIILGIGLR